MRMESRALILKGFRWRARPLWRKTSWILGGMADLWGLGLEFRWRIFVYSMEFILNSRVWHSPLLLGAGELAIEKSKPLIRPLRMPVHRSLPKRCHRRALKSSIPCFAIKFSSIHAGFV